MANDRDVLEEGQSCVPYRSTVVHGDNELRRIATVSQRCGHHRRFNGLDPPAEVKPVPVLSETHRTDFLQARDGNGLVVTSPSNERRLIC